MKGPLTKFNEYFLELYSKEVIIPCEIKSFDDIYNLMVLKPAATLYKSGKTQCYAGRCRSLEDICHCAIHHLGLSPKKVIKLLAKKIIESKTRILFSYCDDIDYFTARSDPFSKGAHTIEEYEEELDYFATNSEDYDYLDYKPDLAMRALIAAMKKELKR